MKRHNTQKAEMPMVSKKRHLCKGILAMLILIFLGCATAPPKPITIKHHHAPFQGGTSVSSTQNQKNVADGSSAALVDLLKKKNVISSDEADRFIKEKGAATSSDDIAALVELLKKKNVVSADEAARFVKQSEIPAAPEKVTATSSKTNDKKQSEKIPASLDEEPPKSIPAQVKNDEQKDILSEATTKDKKQSEKTPAGVVSEEMKKDIPEPVTNDEQKDVFPEAAKTNEKEQNEKTSAGVSEEMRKETPEQVKNDEQKEVPQEAVKDDKEQNEKTPASVNEELKNNPPDQVKNDEQKVVPPETAKSDKEQSEKIPASISEELKKDIQEQVKIQVQEEIPKEVKKMNFTAALPEWIKRIRFEGDTRLRYEGDRFDQNNGYYFIPGTPTSLMNTMTDHDYFRYRVRVGAEVPVNDQVDAIIRLATGNDTNPISTNSTMGDYMNRDRVYFDLAYIRWHPWKFLSFEGGRIPNPWFSSDLVWSPNLNFEGFALRVNKPITETLTPFLTVGAFPLQQDSLSSNSKYLTAGQLGLERKLERGISWKIGTAYYYFSNITGIMNNDSGHPDAMDWSAPLYQQKGNTIFNIATSGSTNPYLFALASEFRELNITANFDIGFWDPVHIVFLGDYVRNLGFDLSDVLQRTGVPNARDIDGYQIGVSVGYPKIQEFGQWRAYLYYKYLGADAVVDAFTDSDFHLGGTDAKGWIVGSDLGLSKNFWFSVRWLTANEIHGNQLTQSGFGGPLAIDVIQVDLNARF